MLVTPKFGIAEQEKNSATTQANDILGFEITFCRASCFPDCHLLKNEQHVVSYSKYVIFYVAIITANHQIGFLAFF